MINKASLLLALTIFLTGCVAAVVGGAAGAGAGAVYYMGELKADVNAKPIAIAQATKQAFNALSVQTEEFQQTDLDAKITGHTANDEKITVTVKRITETVSELEIRVGFFGDETLSQLIYNEIIRQLNAAEHAQPTMASATTTPAPMVTPAPATTPTPLVTPPPATSSTTSVVTPTVTPSGS